MGVAVPIISSLAQGATSLVGAASGASAIKAEARFGAAQAASQTEFEARQVESERKFSERQLVASRKQRERAISETIEAGEFEARNRRRLRQQLISQQRVGFAGQGVETFSGSAERVQEATKAVSAADISSIRANSLRQALGMKLEGVEEEFGVRSRLEDLEFRTRTAGLNRQLAARVGKLSAGQRARTTVVGGALDAINSFGRAALALKKPSKKSKKDEEKQSQFPLSSTFKTFQPKFSKRSQSPTRLVDFGPSFLR